MSHVIAVTPAQFCDPKIAIAACRAGSIGILDLGYKEGSDKIKESLENLRKLAGENAQWGVRWDMLEDPLRSPAVLADLLQVPAPVLVLAGIPADSITGALDEARKFGRQILLEVTSPEEAKAAQAAGYDGLIAKGNESGGRVGRLGSYLFLQHLKKSGITIPYWIQGGAGLHTTAAALMAGAAGVVLCEQLWLTDESPFSQKERDIFERMDGSETVCIGEDDATCRCYSRSGRSKIREVEVALASSANGGSRSSVSSLLRSNDALISMGQGIALAASLARRFGTVGRVITGIEESSREHLRLARENPTLVPDSSLAAMHGTRYPITQGPMARVSDVVPFAKAVASSGGLPFLALSLMNGQETRTMLMEAKQQMGDMPWGIGILGFLPQYMRKEQMEALNEIRPPFAVIAGGRPNQAVELEALGISSYLHIPSPRMLEIALDQGVRKFIFEGSECGGHIGPRTCFVLWESAVSVFLESKISKPEEVQVLFAGGIHDALSAAMAATIAAPLAERGMKIGIQMGTAYMYTHEIIESGAIIPEFQRQAMQCDSTVVLQSGTGHASRCLQTPYSEEFYKTKQELLRQGKNEDEVRLELEKLNLGRVRMASRGIARIGGNGQAKGSLTEIDEAAQRLQGMYMIGQVAELRDRPISIAELHAGISEGCKEYLAEVDEPRIEADNSRHNREAIAIVGMACMFPEASDIRTYWQNILNRVCTIREVDPERWDPEVMFTPDRMETDRTYSKWGSFLHDVAFNPIKYGIPPSTLKSIDPVQLLALEAAHQAIEDAGFNQKDFPRERTSVFFGAGGPNERSLDYGVRTSILHCAAKVEEVPAEMRRQFVESVQGQLPVWTEDSFPGFLDNVITGRISNRLNLGGSNYTVNAACATSFAALEIGIRQLQNHDCDVAIIGAADTNNNIMSYLSFSRVQAMSPRGQSRPFDDSADGMVLGEGVGVVVLKRLSEAERDGDRIYAVIKGIGSSSDGRNRSLTAPHSAGQVKALERAYRDAGVSPTSVEMVEAHGTGTALGDSTEINTLKDMFDRYERTDRQYCAVGSVKSMIGHTKIAAGMAGLIKCVLALQHKIIPPTIGVETPTSVVDFAKSPFYIVSEPRPWVRSAKDQPRRAALSSFGFGGTNFHVVVEEYTGDLRESSSINLLPREAEVFSIVREKRSDVEESLKQFAQKLGSVQAGDMPQLAYSFFLDEQKKRRSSEKAGCRLSIVAVSIDDLKRKLDRALKEIPTARNIKNPSGIYYSEGEPVDGGVCFLYPGQGAQRVNMLRDLVMGIPSVIASLEYADEILKGKYKKPLSQYIYPIPVFSDEERKRQYLELTDTHVSQPAIGLMDMVATDILGMYGIRPDFTAGHSYGENIALWAAGAISREDILRLSEIRGRIINETGNRDNGGMAAVFTDGKKTASIMEELGLRVYLANLNSPEQTIIAGAGNEVDVAVKAFNDKGIRSKRIPVSAAFHTPLVSEACEILKKELAKIDLKKPQLKVFSNTTAGLYPESPDEMRDLLGWHPSLPVYFSDQIAAMYQAGARVFIEAGPGRILTNLVDQNLAAKSSAYTVLTMDVTDRPAWVQLGHLLAHAVAVGLPVDLAPWFEGRSLKRMGIDAIIEKAGAEASNSRHLWRMNGARVRPWNEVAQPARLPAPPMEATVRKEPPQPRHPSMPVSGMPANTMQLQPRKEDNIAMKQSVDSSKSEEKREIEIATPSEDPGVIMQVQSTLSQFIELHRDQQKVMHRFIDMQEGMVQKYLKNGVTSLSGGSAYTMPRLQPPVEVKKHVEPSSPPEPPIVMTGVTPAPVIPTLPTQITGVATSPPPPVQSPPALQPASSIPNIVIPGTIISPEASRQEGSIAYGAPAAASEPATGEKSIPGKDEFQDHLLRLVTERTGYPPDMLDIDAHMESDLGIDSIKKIEIFAGMKDQYEVMRMLDEESLLEQLSHHGTLRSIVDWYDESRTRIMESNASSSSPSSVVPNREPAMPDPRPAMSYPEPAVPMEMVPAPRLPLSSSSSGVGMERNVAHGPHAMWSTAAEVAFETLDTLTMPEEEPTKESFVQDPVKRLIVRPTVAPLNTNGEMSAYPPEYAILVLGEGSDFIKTIYGSLELDAYQTIHVVPGEATRSLGDNRYEVDVASLESIRELRSMVIGSGSKVGAIFNLTALGRYSDESVEEECVGLEDAGHLFLMLKVFGEDLQEAGSQGAGWLVNFTAMGGRFGFDSKSPFSVGQAGTVGVVKSIAREWPEIKAKSIDLDPQADPQALAINVLQELALFDDLVEVGLDDAGRWKMELVEDGSASKVYSLRLLDQESVVLVTGGAYGVTSEVSKALASKYQPTIILVGRTPLPGEEPQEMRELRGTQELRQYFIHRSRQENVPLTPALIEKKVRDARKARQIRENIEAMTRAGARVEYHAMDVRDAELFGKLIDDVYGRYGRLDGVVHGAGINEDKLVKDKSPESFGRVFDTKIIPAGVMAEKIRPEGFKFLVFFSSVAGRFGNVGQTDYSAANEVLNKLAGRLSNKWPGHIIAINWGPWDSGMVTEELGRLFNEKGIHLIPTAEGVKMFLAELNHTEASVSEVVISRSVKQISEVAI